MRSIIKRKMVLAAASAGATLMLAESAMAQLTLSGTSYTQTFDSVGTAYPTGWTGRTGATSSALGTTSALTTTATSWGDTGASFKNVASADGLTSGSSTTAQSGSTDRALGIRQSGTFGDPGAAFTLQIGNTTGLTDFAFGFSAQMLSVQPRSTTWTVQYGLGASPTSFTTLATYTDPGSFGSTAITVSSSTLGTALNNQSQNVWIRVVALTASSGSGSRDTIAIDDFTMTWTSGAPVGPSFLYFDPNQNAAGIGGAGAWDTTSTNWTTVAAGDVATTSYSAVPLIFGGTGGAVSVATGITVSGAVSIQSSGYSFSGGSIILNTDSSFVVSDGVTTTVDTSLEGGTLTKAGSGILVLGGTNSHSGTVINAGGLQVGSDAALGTGGVTLGGGSFIAGSSFTANRGFSGSGGINTGGNSLTIGGSAQFTSLAVSGTSLTLAGPTNTATSLTIADQATVNVTGGTLVTPSIAATAGSGTATVNGPISISGGTLTPNVAEGGTLVLGGAIAGSTSGISSNSSVIAKTIGTGTLQLTGTGSTYRTVRLGVAGTAPSNGGTLLFDNVAALGEINGPTQTLQLNYGKFVNNTGSAATIQKAVSFGATDVTLAGSPMTFDGTVSNAFFHATGASYAGSITLETAVTLEDGLTAGSGAGTITGLTLKGSGSLTVNGATNTYGGHQGETITVQGATLGVNGNMVSLSAVALTSGGTLRGTGTISGAVTATSGTIAPGNGGIGTLTIGDVDMQAGSTFSVDLNASGSGDKLVVTGTGLIDGILTGTSSGTFTNGQVFTIVDGLPGEIAGEFDGFGELGIVTLSGNEFTISYVGGDGNDITLTAVPDPASLSLLALGGMGLLRRRRRAVTA